MLSSVVTSDIRQTLDSFRRSVDQLFENFYGYPTEAGRTVPTGAGTQYTFNPVIESAWTDSSLHLRAILPGVTQNNLKVSIQNNQLVIEGERKAPEGFEKSHFTQLAYGKFYATITLPVGLDLDKLNCRLHDGVLDVQIPVAEQMRPRQIQVQAGEQPQRRGVTA